MIEYEPHRSSSAEYYIIQHDVNFSFPYHMHKSFEFICVTDGSIICTVNGKDFVLSKNRAMLILPHEPHSYRTEDHSESSIESSRFLRVYQWTLFRQSCLHH